MRKYLILAFAIMAMVPCFILGSHHEKASATPSSTSRCTYAFNITLNNATDYPCPVPTVAPVVNGTIGYSAYAFEDQFGINTHMVDTEFNNFNFVQSLLLSMNIHHIRDGLATVPGNPYVINSLNTLAANGIHTSLTTTNKYTASQIDSIVSLLNPGVVESIEGPNELDVCCGDTNFVADDKYSMMEGVSPYVKAHRPIKAIGPSIGGFGSYAVLGDLSAYEDYGNTHDYDGAYYPETTGYGGVYYGYGYGSVLYNLSNAKQASLSKPIIATEFGFQIDPFKQNFVDESTQGTFLLRQIFQHWLDGVPKSYIYALIDTGGQTFGLVDMSGPYIRPSVRVISGFNQILKEDAPLVGQCVVPFKVNQVGVLSIPICKANGEFDVILWQPTATRDPSSLTDTTFSPDYTDVRLVPGFTPSTVSQWSYDLTGHWTNNTAINIHSVAVLDRPSIVVINGPASPTPVPAIPTAPPPPPSTPAPTPVPTPTPAPTAKPTVVAIRQMASTVIANGVNVTQTFANPVQYGDYLLTGWGFSQYGANRYVVRAPSIMSRIDPAQNQQTNIDVPLACSPITDFQGYEEVCLDVWGGYVSDQGGAGTQLNWVASTGFQDSSVIYDFTGTDSTAPIGQSQTSLYSYNMTTCPSVTVTRIGSMPICIVAAKDGAGFGPGRQLSAGYTNNGWIFDGNQFSSEAVTYEFHYPATTTANQVIPAFTFQDTGTFLDYSVDTTFVVQPPL